MGLDILAIQMKVARSVAENSFVASDSIAWKKMMAEKPFWVEDYSFR